MFNRFVRNIIQKTYLSLYIACGNLIVNVNQTVRFEMSNSKDVSVIFLVLFEPRSGSSVVDSSSGGVVAPPVGTASSLSSPSIIPTFAAVSCLAPSSPRLFVCSGCAFCRFGLSSGAIISTSTNTTWEGCKVVGVSDHFLGSQNLSSWLSGVTLFHTSRRRVGCVHQVVGQKGTSRCLVGWYALVHHLLSILFGAASIVCTCSSDMGPCVGERF